LAKEAFEQIKLEMSRIKDPLKRRIVASRRLARVLFVGKRICLTREQRIEAVAVLLSESTSQNQKFAARSLLEIEIGAHGVNQLLEDEAIVKSREDPLVATWRRNVLKRDGYSCRKCRSNDNLCAHHILHWSDSPATRIKVNNGITLCAKCHAAEHEGERVHGLMVANIR
jgi:hypothetical protein